MDNNIISTSKIISTTPFSINDILTKNNTTLFRRTAEKTTLICGPTNNDRACDSDKKQFNHNQRKSIERKLLSNNQFDNNFKNNNNDQHCSMQYFNNNNSVCAANFNTNRRKSLDCFLIENDMAKDRLSDCERYNGDKHSGFENKNRFCGYGSGEIPLDMRRCNSNDSGMFITTFCISTLYIFYFDKIVNKWHTTYFYTC